MAGMAGTDEKETTMSAVTWDAQPAFALPARRSAAGRGAGEARRAGRDSGTGSGSVVTDAGLRLTRRGRTVLTALAVLLTLAAAFTAQRADADGASAATPVVTHTVVAGETLWGIASSVAVPGEDVRDVVDRLMELNGLHNGGLRSGQQILVPTAP